MELDSSEKINFFSSLTNKVKNLLKYIRFHCSECDLCSGKFIPQVLICQHCIDDLPLFTYQHLHHNLLNWPAINTLFPQRHFDHLLCLAPYQWPFDHWLKQFKYHKRFELAQLFANLLFTLWNSNSDKEANSAIVAVPVHLKKWQNRGYNQAHLIAKYFAKKSQLSYLDNILRRVEFSESQVGQSGVARRKRLKNAFEVRSSNIDLPERIILLDDVITTGTTANSIARLLKAKGVKHITVLTVAFTLPKNVINKKC